MGLRAFVLSGFLAVISLAAPAEADATEAIGSSPPARWDAVA